MILIINKNKENAIAFSDMFYYMGVLAKAATAREAFSFFGEGFSAALVFLHEDDKNTVELILRLHTIAPTFPIFTVGNPPTECKNAIAHSFESNTFAPAILSKIIEYAKENELRTPGEYRLAGLDACRDIGTPRYFDSPIHFTRTELMIIRYLIRAYPGFASPDEILRFAYRESRLPEAANVKTHISIINKKFRDLFERNLIEAQFGKGYRIITPETIFENI